MQFFSQKIRFNRNFSQIFDFFSLEFQQYNLANHFMLENIFRRFPKMVIDSQDSLERAALEYGLLPFFSNPIRGFSVAEMAAPGMLFGGNEGYDGCWEWKGPVIQQQTTAYGKFFRNKAGFVALELLPDFLNYRRHKYPVEPDSTEAMILDIIRQNEGMTSTELRKLINTYFISHKDAALLNEEEFSKDSDENGDRFRPKRSSLEGPLRRLQMGGWLLIANFEYKLTRRGDRYGWGVALYSTPEIWFGRLPQTQRTPQESIDFLVNRLSSSLPHVNKKAILKLLS